MSLLDDLMKHGGDLGSLAAKNPQIVAALISLLSSRDSSVGGSGGLGGLIDVFQRLTPEGTVPEGDTFESALGGLFGGSPGRVASVGWEPAPPQAQAPRP